MTSLEEDYQTKEQQILVLEKQAILEFESHLAAASTKMEINEQTSLLLPQCMELRPQGDARRPPQNILDQLQALNNSHRLGHLLCRYKINVVKKKPHVGRQKIPTLGAKKAPRWVPKKYNL